MTAIGSLTVDGSIAMDGSKGGFYDPETGQFTAVEWSDRPSGGGSGGSILVSAPTVTINGVLTANGGVGMDALGSQDTATGGGGGRIAIHCTSTCDLGSATVTAYGGLTPDSNAGDGVAPPGGPGTVYIATPTAETLLIDNNGAGNNASAAVVLETLPNLTDVILAGDGLVRL